MRVDRSSWRRGTVLAQSEGASPTRERELQRAADRLIATSDIPAVITLVEQDGKRTVVASGDAEIGRRKARPEDRFWVGSITKSFVATVVHAARRRAQVAGWTTALVRSSRDAFARDGGSGSGICSTTRAAFPNYMGLEPWGSAMARNPRAVISPRRLVSSAAGYRSSSRPEAGLPIRTPIISSSRRSSSASPGRSPRARLLRERIFEPLGLDGNGLRGQTPRPSATTSCTATTSPDRRRRTSRGTGSGVPGPTARSCRTRTTSRCSSSRCCAESSSRRDSSPRWRRSFPARTARAWVCTSSRSPCGRWFYGHTGGTPGYVTFAAGSRDGSRFFVVDWNGVSRDAIDAMDKYLDDLICRS